MISSFRNILSYKNLNIIARYSTNIVSNEFTPIYKFPYIRACGIINQLKFYQSITTAIIVPSSLILFNYGLVSEEIALILNATGFSTTLSLFLLGMIPYKLIGFIYLKEDNNIVKISYLDFWGQRRDKLLPLSDLVPISDLPAIPTDSVYLTMRRFSSSETFKINIKFGQILEKNKFKNVFLQEVKQ